MAEWFDQDTQQWYSTETEQWNPIEVDEAISPPDVDYVAPSWGEIGFNFTPGGYVAPPWSEIPFEWFGAIAEVFDLGASITVDPTRTDAPYCELKRSNKIALGFGGGGWQILQGKVEYTCVYDLNAIIEGIPPHADLGAYIFAFKTFSGTKDLGGILSGWAERDLGGTIYGIPPRDLGAYIKSTIQEYADLGAYIRAWHIFDLIGIIGGVDESDIIAVINAIPPKDLPAYIKAYSSEDLPATIFGWAEKDLGAIINSIFSADLPAAIDITSQGFKDLRAYIRCWQREVPVDLGAYLFAYNYDDLPAIIRAKEFGEIWATIYGIPPANLPAFIYGWAVRDLPAIINGQFGPGDLQAQIFGVGSINLPAIIEGIRQGIVDLGAFIQPQVISDLGAYIATTGDYKDLGAYVGIFSGARDLQGIITPRLVKFAMLMPVHTMEARDLNAVISLAPCWYQEVKDLGASLKAIYQGNMPATIYGFRADFWSQVKDLAAFISTEPLSGFPRATDSIPITFTAKDNVYAFDDLPVQFWDKDKHPTDELDVEFIPGGGRRIQNFLNAYINPTPEYHDLPATIEGIIQLPYEYRRDNDMWLYNDLSTFIAPYIYNNMELFSKIVQIRFLSGVYDYFYQSASTTLWKEDSDAKWIIDVSSWDEETEYFADKKDEKTKIVFDLTQFESIDEAVRYAIDWVLAFPQRDLFATITGSVHEITKLKDLAATISGGGKIYSSAYNLPASTTPWHPRELPARMRIYGNGLIYGGQQYRDLIARVGYWWIDNIGATIQCVNWKEAHVEMEGAYAAPDFDDVDVEL